MKKLLLISVLLGSIILTGCGQQQGLSESELFTKKQECVSYQKDMERDIEKSGYKDYIILEIFYSPSLNSCLYEFNNAEEALILNDFFSKKEIGSAGINCKNDPSDSCIDQQRFLFNTIQGLKGE